MDSYDSIPSECRESIKTAIDQFLMAVAQVERGRMAVEEEDKARQWLMACIAEACMTAHCEGQGLC